MASEGRVLDWQDIRMFASCEPVVELTFKAKRGLEARVACRLTAPSPMPFCHWAIGERSDVVCLDAVCNTIEVDDVRDRSPAKVCFATRAESVFRFSFGEVAVPCVVDALSAARPFHWRCAVCAQTFNGLVALNASNMHGGAASPKLKRTQLSLQSKEWPGFAQELRGHVANDIGKLGYDGWAVVQGTEVMLQ